MDKIHKIYKLLKVYLRQSIYSLVNKKVKRYELIYYFPKWFFKNILGQGTLSDRKPWLVFSAIRKMDKITNMGMKVFEFGSGGSTLFFVDKGCTVNSVEHDAAWFNKVSTEIKSEGWAGFLKVPNTLDNKIMKVKIPPHDSYYDEKSDTDPFLYLSNMSKYSDLCFKDYVTCIDVYPDDYFDIVLIDGRARNSCWIHSREKIKHGGYLVLDNSDRKNYSRILQEVKELGWREFIFYGPGPYETVFWETRIWQKPLS